MTLAAAETTGRVEDTPDHRNRPAGCAASADSGLARPTVVLRDCGRSGRPPPWPAAAGPDERSGRAGRVRERTSGEPRAPTATRRPRVRLLVPRGRVERAPGGRRCEAPAMPDWSYRTVLRPLLFLLPPETARDLSLGRSGSLGRSRLGVGGDRLPRPHAGRPAARDRAISAGLPHGRRPRRGPRRRRRRHVGPGPVRLRVPRARAR